MSSTTGAGLLDILKQKMQQSKDELEKHKEEAENMEGEVWVGPPAKLSRINHQERKVEETEELPSYRAQVMVMRVDTEVGEVKEVSKVAIECMIMELEDTTEAAEAVIMAAE